MPIQAHCLGRPIPKLLRPLLLIALLLFSLSGASSNAASEVQLTGMLTTIWEDSRGNCRARQYLQRTGAPMVEVELSPGARVGGLRGPKWGIPCRLSGTWVMPRRARFRASRVLLDPSSSAPQQAAAPAGVVGSRRYITILVRFADTVNVTPVPPPFWTDLLVGTTFPRMGHWLAEASYGQFNLLGSQTTGWYNLPNPASYYLDATGAFRDAGELMEHAATLADPDVDFRQYDGINVVVNQRTSVILGGGYFLNRDGVGRGYSATWLFCEPGEHNTWQGGVAHELGHSFGLPHTSGFTQDKYTSHWDCMGSGGSQGLYAPYANVGVPYHGFYRDYLGWIPGGRRATVPPGGRQVLRLERLNQPVSNADPLLVVVPIYSVQGRYYTAEARRRVGYDTYIPGEGVVIHRVDPEVIETNANYSKVVDSDGNGDPNDAGAIWTPGETFRDPSAGISITVESADSSGYVLTVDNTTTLNEVNGLTATYYGRADFTQPVVTRVDPWVYFNWSGEGVSAPITDGGFYFGPPDPRVPVDQFSVRWTGTIRPPATAAYTFYTWSDESMRVFVNGQLVVDDSVPHFLREASGTITLQANRYYDLQVEFADFAWGATAKLLWSSPSIQKSPVPPSALYAYPVSRISGTVNAQGTPLPGVTVAAGNRTTITGADGTYSLYTTPLPGVLVTPSKTGYLFTPSNRNVVATGDASGVDFSAAPAYTVSGTVSAGGAPLAGVNVSASGRSAQTNAGGTYLLTLPTGSHLITLSKTEYTFTPPSRQVVVGPNLTGIDFQGTANTYGIQGRVIQGGSGLPGVTLNAGSQTMTTGPDGSFAFTGLLAGTYSLTPTLTEHTFTPATRSVTVGPSQSSIDFVSAVRTYTVRGNVAAGTSGISGVTVSAGGSSTLTDAGGDYLLTGLPAGTYELVANKTPYTFTPAFRTVTVGPDRTGINFTGQRGYTISGTVIKDRVPLAGVSLTAGGRTTTSDSSGNYFLEVPSRGTLVVTPSLVGHTFTPASRVVTVGPDDAAGINFSASAGFTVGGRIMQNSMGLSGVTVRAGAVSTTTGADGSYTLMAVPAGTWTVEALKAGYAFTPASLQVTVGPSRTGIDFTATAVPTLVSIRLAATAVRGGKQVSGELILSGALSAKVVIPIQTSNGNAATVLKGGASVAQRKSSGKFKIKTIRVASPTNVILSANFGGVNQQVTLTVLP